jgi:hypothetical protein
MAAQAILRLQRSHGNAFVQRLIQTQTPNTLQRKTATQPNQGVGAQAVKPALPSPASAEATGGLQTARPAVEKAGAPQSPGRDARYQGVIERLEKTARNNKAHEPAAKKVADARAASIAPANDRRSRAQANQVEVMDRQEAKKPKTDDFLSMLRAEIARIAPRNMDETEKFKKEGKAAELKGALTSRVEQRKDAATQNIEGATEATPDPNSVAPKEVTPMPPEPGDAPSPDLHSQDVLPQPKPDAQVSVEANKKKADKLMAENDIDEAQLRKANEPQFSAALDAKKGLEAHVAQVPGTYRREEQAYLKNAGTQLSGEAKGATAAMLSTRSGSKGKVKGRQLEAKRREEEERKKVADKIQGIYAETRKRVEDKLSGLDKEVNASFDRGEKAAREHFESFVDRRMADYKFNRYLIRLGGPLLWAKDKLFGLPEEVNRFYEEGRDRYLREMDVVITGIANTVESRLKEAKSEIAGGRRKIRDYVESLPKDLQQAGRQAEREVSARFDELAQSVDDKKKDLAQSLAKRYVEARNSLDERIKELKAENGGLVNKFIDKLKDVIQILANFKARISSLLRKSADVIRQIVKDPIGFLRNLTAAVKQGFNQFARNILKHLQSGLMGWLFGAFAGAGIQSPSGFSVKALFGLVLQVLGVTREHVRAKLVKKLGARNAARIEQAWSLVSAMIGGSIVGLWGQAKGYLGDFKEMVVSEIRNWVIIQIVKAAILWLISLLNPASALVRAIIAIYNVVMFFIERMNQIRRLVQAIVESVTSIVAGNIGAAANWIEQAMGRSVPVILGFLANLLGLTGITQKIQSIIRKVQRPVDMAIDKVITKVVSKLKPLLTKAKAGAKNLGKKGKEAITSVFQWWKIKQRFRGQDGQTHTVYFKDRSAGSDLMVASDPLTVSDFLLRKRKAVGKIQDGEVKQEQLRTLDEAESLNKQVENSKIALIKADTGSKTVKQSKPEQENQVLYNQLSQLVDKLAAKLKLLYVTSETDFPTIVLPPFSDNVKAHGIKAEFLRKEGLPDGAPANAHKGRLGGWDTITKHKLSDEAKWVKMHLLSERLGGKATDSNLTPARGSETNLKFYSDMERHAIKMIESNSEKIIWYEVNVTYHPPPYEKYINHIDAKWGTYKKQGSSWTRGTQSNHAFSQNPAPPELSNMPEPVDFNSAGRDKMERIVNNERFARAIFDERKDGKFGGVVNFMARMRKRSVADSATFQTRMNLIVNAVAERKVIFDR